MNPDDRGASAAIWILAVVAVVAVAAALVGFLGRAWETRCGEPPVAASELTGDPVFQIALDEGTPEEVHGISGTGDECGALGNPESTAFRVWRSASRPSDSLLLDAATEIESLGVPLETLICRRNGSMSFGGAKSVSSGDSATLEITGRASAEGSEVSVRLYVRPRPDETLVTPTRESASEKRVEGDCSPELIAVLE